MRRITLVVVLILLSPWILGLAYNTFHLWHDHVYHWGRLYNRSGSSDIDESLADESIPLPVFLAGSTFLPSPTVALGTSYAPTLVVVEVLPRSYVVYALVGGP